MTYNVFSGTLNLTQPTVLCNGLMDLTCRSLIGEFVTFGVRLVQCRESREPTRSGHCFLFYVLNIEFC